MGTCKMRNEIETKRNERNRNDIHRNETKRNLPKRNEIETIFTETKRNLPKRNENDIHRNETKFTETKRNRNNKIVSVNIVSISFRILQVPIKINNTFLFIFYFFNLPMCTPWRDSVYAATPLMRV